MNLELLAAITSVGFYRGPYFQTICKVDGLVSGELSHIRPNFPDLPYFKHKANMLITIRGINCKEDAKNFISNLKFA